MNNCVVVTGGGRNIGLAISRRLQQDGYRVIVLDIEAPLDDALKADAVQVDLSQPEAARRVLEQVRERFAPTRLVCNVGIVEPALLQDVTLESFERLMTLNAKSALLSAQALIPTMRQAGFGRIVINTSRVVLGKELRTAYSATKGALQAMARTWALELAGDNITVNCVAPGPIATTAFWKNNPPESEQARKIVNGIPLKRMGEPEDVANAVSFFCDDRTGFVTGQSLFICGGVTVGLAGT